MAIPTRKLPPKPPEKPITTMPVPKPKSPGLGVMVGASPNFKPSAKQTLKHKLDTIYKRKPEAATQASSSGKGSLLSQLKGGMKAGGSVPTPPPPPSTPLKGGPATRRSAQQTFSAMMQKNALQAQKDAEMSKKLREAYEREQSQADSGMKKGGKVGSSASKRADGCAMKGKTRGKMI